MGYDGQTSHATYEACEQARRTRTIGGAAIGGLVGAGLGALAGGDDTRNAVVGGLVGAAAGGTIGSRQVSCAAYEYRHGGHNQYSYSQPQYQQQPAYSYNTQPSYQYSSPGYTTTTRSYSSGSYYPQQQYGSYPTQTTTRTYTTTRPAGSYNSGHYNSGYGYQQAPSYSYSQQQPTTRYYSAGQPYGSQQQQQRWSYDGRTVYGSYDACERARRDRMIAGGGLGALAGAGLGTLRAVMMVGTPQS